MTTTGRVARRPAVALALAGNLVLGFLGVLPIFLWVYPALWLAGDPEHGPASVLWALLTTLGYLVTVVVLNLGVARLVQVEARRRYWRVSWVVLVAAWVVTALALFPPLRPPPL